MTLRPCARLLLTAVALLFGASAAEAQLVVPVQFDFLNPSARSLALGGAFVGLADDATAALVNPAGLIELTRKEISVEGRIRHVSQPYLVGGRLSGTITRQGQDTVAGPEFGSLDTTDGSLNFISFVYPRGRFRLAAFRHELIHVEQEYNSRGVFQNQGFDTRDSAFSAERTLGIDTYGASVAFDARKVRLGAGLLVQHFSLGFEFDRFVFPDLYGTPDPQQRVFHFSQNGHDTAVGAVVGVLVPISTAKIGVSYKRAPRFGFTSCSFTRIDPQQCSDATFKVPDLFSAGFSIMLTPRFLVTTEYARAFHSQLRSDYIDAQTSQGEAGGLRDRFTIDDAHEAHVGAEYLLPFAGRPAIRGGFWFDPDHSVHYAPTGANDLLDERLGATLSTGRDLWHYTLGTMVAVHSRVDLSAAVDHSARSTVVSTSAIIRF